MTEKLFTGTLNKNQNKSKKLVGPGYCLSIYVDAHLDVIDATKAIFLFHLSSQMCVGLIRTIQS